MRFLVELITVVHGRDESRPYTDGNTNDLPEKGIIWCPKRRRKVLIHQIGKWCFVRAWPSVSATDIVKECKGF